MKTPKKKPRHNWRPFEEARNFTRGLGLQNQSDWTKWSKSDARPDDIPAAPRDYYQNTGWMGWGDWLGTDHIAPQNMIYRPFKEARAFARSLGLANWDGWVKWTKSHERPRDIPANPYGVYKGKGWIGLGDWLGTGRIANKDIIYRPFESAREFVHSLKLNRPLAKVNFG